jgi:hypothetical protein
MIRNRQTYLTPDEVIAVLITVLPRVPGDCRVCGVAHRQAASLRSKIQPGKPLGRWQLQLGSDKTAARPFVHLLDDDLHWDERPAGV